MRVHLAPVDPSLRPWFWAVSIVALLGVALSLVSLWAAPPRSQAFVEFNRSRIALFANGAAPAADGVLMLGNSRLKYATFAAEEMERLAADSGAAPVRVLSLFNNGAVFDDFQPLVDGLFETQPHVIVFQVDLLGLEPFEPDFAWSAKIFLRYLRWSLVGSGPWEGYLGAPEPAQFERPCEIDQSKERLKRRLAFRPNIDPNGPNARMAVEFLRRAADRGIDVVLVSLQRSPRLEAEKPPVPRSLEGLVGTLTSASERIHLWQYPGEMAGANYCDFHHMNPQGRELYSKWLTSRLSELLRSRRGA